MCDPRRSTSAICKLTRLQRGKAHSANGTNFALRTLRKSLGRAINIMPSRPHGKSPPGVPSESEFTFHLVAKQTATGAGVIAGAIVTGPVGSLFDDALGSAF